MKEKRKSIFTVVVMLIMLYTHPHQAAALKEPSGSDLAKQGLGYGANYVLSRAQNIALNEALRLANNPSAYPDIISKKIAQVATSASTFSPSEFVGDYLDYKKYLDWQRNLEFIKNQLITSGVSTIVGAAFHALKGKSPIEYAQRQFQDTKDFASWGLNVGKWAGNRMYDAGSWIANNAPSVGSLSALAGSSALVGPALFAAPIAATVYLQAQKQAQKEAALPELMKKRDEDSAWLASYLAAQAKKTAEGN